MGSNWTLTSTLAVVSRPSAFTSVRRVAGYLPVQQTPTLHGTCTTGGVSFEVPRSTDITVQLQIQPITGANATSVSAAKGSEKPATQRMEALPLGTQASGVPPRSRPV